jgi:hypothetical protein
MKLLSNLTWSGRSLGLAAVALVALGIGSADAQSLRRNNPPGPRGGPGTNWVRPVPWAPRAFAPVPPFHRRLHRHGPTFRGGFAFGFGYGYGVRRPGFRSNPPGPRGGWGTNWANPPGPAGGPGASPYRLRPYRRWR